MSGSSEFRFSSNGPVSSTAPTWISVSERLPKEIENGRRWVEVWDSHWNTCYYATFDGEEWHSAHREKPIVVSHWRPLPDPPLSSPATGKPIELDGADVARNPSK